MITCGRRSRKGRMAEDERWIAIAIGIDDDTLKQNKIRDLILALESLGLALHHIVRRKQTTLTHWHSANITIMANVYPPTHDWHEQLLTKISWTEKDCCPQIVFNILHQFNALLWITSIKIIAKNSTFELDFHKLTLKKYIENWRIVWSIECHWIRWAQRAWIRLHHNHLYEHTLRSIKYYI